MWRGTRAKCPAKTATVTTEEQEGAGSSLQRQACASEEGSTQHAQRASFILRVGGSWTGKKQKEFHKEIVQGRAGVAHGKAPPHGQG